MERKALGQERYGAVCRPFRLPGDLFEGPTEAGGLVLFSLLTAAGYDSSSGFRGAQAVVELLLDV